MMDFIGGVRFEINFVQGIFLWAGGRSDFCEFANVFGGGFGKSECFLMVDLWFCDGDLVLFRGS
jgi:hypothetical protein